MPSVLFVCLGNICRSPTAEAVFRHQAMKAGLEIRIDSAGTSAAHQGERPDPRSMAAGQRRGYDFSGQYSRQVTAADFGDFDYILAMDSQNLYNLKQLQPANSRASVQLFLDFAKVPNKYSDTYKGAHTDIPDPYYGGARGFDRVLDLVEAASHGLIHHIKMKDETG